MIIFMLCAGKTQQFFADENDYSVNGKDCLNYIHTTHK